MMNRNVKALGLSLIAALAMSAMTASTVSASPFFTADNYPAHLDGTENPGNALTLFGNFARSIFPSSTSKASQSQRKQLLVKKAQTTYVSRAQSKASKLQGQPVIYAKR